MKRLGSLVPRWRLDPPISLGGRRKFRSGAWCGIQLPEFGSDRHRLIRMGLIGNWRVGGRHPSIVTRIWMASLRDGILQTVQRIKSLAIVTG